MASFRLVHYDSNLWREMFGWRQRPQRMRRQLVTHSLLPTILVDGSAPFPQTSSMCFFSLLPPGCALLKASSRPDQLLITVMWHGLFIAIYRFAICCWSTRYYICQQFQSWDVHPLFSAHPVWKARGKKLVPKEKSEEASVTASVLFSPFDISK